MFLLKLLPLFLLAAILQAAEDRPNFIFIYTDDQRADALGFSGNDIIHTPEMDRLAREGTYFRNSFVTTPICAAARASIFTGLYERTHDYTFRKPPLAETYYNDAFPALLRKAGYNTSLFGKLGVNFANEGQNVLFDHLDTTGTAGYFRLRGGGGRNHRHLTDDTTDKALAYLDELPREQPFFLALSFNAPHADDSHPQQYFWPPRNDPLYNDVTIPLTPLHAPAYFEALPDFLKDEDYMGRIRWIWRFQTPELHQRMVKGYYRMISTIDDNIGRVREYLEVNGLAENTVIIFTSDNGYFLGERALAGKWLMYEDSIRVPLIIHDPRVEGGLQTRFNALNLDVAPTILDFAGIDLPERYQGHSLRPLVEGGTLAQRDAFLLEHHYDLVYIPRSEGLRTNNWKLFRYPDNGGLEELYDLYRDPLETRNLIDDPQYAEVAEILRAQLDDYIAGAVADR